MHQAPPIFGFPLLVSAKDVFLTINIRRNNLIEDALNELSKNDIKLQNPIKVRFIGEQGVDEGGVRKEFFLLFIRQIFDPNYGMFNYNQKTTLLNNINLNLENINKLQNNKKKFCRICYGDEKESPLINACKCSGGLKYVHLFCLRYWIKSKSNFISSNDDCLKYNGILG